MIPTYPHDIYTREAILAPYAHYEAIRALGPVVRLGAQRVLAVGRYEQCKAVLLDDEAFVSGKGVALNTVANRMSRGTTLASDGIEHTERRALLAHRLTPRALRSMREQVESAARQVVGSAVEAGRLDAVDDLAVPLPMAIVPDLVGWPQEGREHLLRWAGATFDVLGPLNRQSLTHLPRAAGMMRFARSVARDRTVMPGSMGDDLLRAADDGRLPASGCPMLMVDYLAPSLDTTISAIASAVHLFAQHPDQWELLRRDRSLLANAVNEVVRLESPLRAFSRLCARDTTVGGVPIAAGSRVLVLYASANRDEARWDDPTAFDITRDAARQLGFGHGTHGCAGQGLARMETQAILAALAERVARIELIGEPTWAVNNVIHRLEHLPVELIPAQEAS